MRTPGCRAFLSVGALVHLLGGAQSAFAQLIDMRLEAQVWDGARWASQITVRPGTQVEYRLVVSYSGVRTNVVALGEIKYVVTVEGFDNTGPSLDAHAPLCTSMASCPDACVAGLFSNAGVSPSPRALYGPVNYCEGAFNRAPSLQRWGGDSPQNGAPEGAWATVSTGLASWPGTGTGTQSAINAQRPLLARQLQGVNPITGEANSAWLTGNAELPFFRGAILLSSEAGERSMAIDLRSSTGQPVEVRWQTGAGGSGALTTQRDIIPAFIIVSQCNDIDFNNDGVFPDLQDLADFFGGIAGQGCDTCDSTDFNNDGVFPDMTDAFEFFDVFAGGACGS